MYLYGASGHAKVIIEILELCNIPIDGLFDDNPSIKEILGYTCSQYSDKNKLDNEIILSIGNNAIRKKIANKLNVKYGKVIHPTACISKRSPIGHGTVIMGNSIINSDTQIGDHCIINTSASIDHDCKIENYSHISPNTTICGGVSIDEGTHIGAGATIIPGIKIGKWSTIGAGAVIVKDVPDFAVVVGSPGKIIKYNK